MSMRINVRNFTGTTIPLDVDPQQTISEVKERLAAAGKGKSIRVPALSFKGHELEDTRQLQYYDIVSKDTIHILPPSKVDKITLTFEKEEDGTRFKLTVNSDIKVNQLKREILLEEKVDAKQLKVISTREDPDGEVVTLKDLDDNAVLSTLSLQDDIIAIYTSIRPTPSIPSAFGILLSVDNRIDGTRQNVMSVTIKSDQTLASFKEDVSGKHDILFSDYTLVLIGRELKDDERTLGDLGFTSGCTVHAVAKVQLCVSTPEAGDFEMAVGPMTRISAIRKMLEEVDTTTKYDEYWFTLDGMDNLKESRTFWDLDIFSGTMILLKKRCYITLTIRRHGESGPTFDITAEENDTVEGLQQRILLQLDAPGRLVKLTHRMKVLSRSKTLKQEKLESGEVVDVMFRFTSGGSDEQTPADLDSRDAPGYS